jgi:glutamate 5-kinase
MQGRTKNRTPAVSRLAEARRVVVKVGSALLVDQASGRLNRAWLEALVEDCVRLRRRGQQIILVSSGAIALGRRHLGLPPGRCGWRRAGGRSGRPDPPRACLQGAARGRATSAVAQVLLTLEDSEQRRRYLNARATLNALLELGAIPVINENDTVATAEIRYGDNDRLAARVAQMVERRLPGAAVGHRWPVHGRSEQGPAGASSFPRCADHAAHRGHGRRLGVGRRQRRHGDQDRGGEDRRRMPAATCASPHGAPLHPVRRIEAGARCTWFVPGGSRCRAQAVDRGHAEAAGALHRRRCAARRCAGQEPAAGGRHAARRAGSIAATRWRGDADGREVARGIAAYSDADALRIIGSAHRGDRGLVGFRGRDEMIHRDDLVLRDGAETGPQPK